MKSHLVMVLTAGVWAGTTQALSAAEWEKQSIYQVMTDRFARTDGSTDAACPLRKYCGGTWRGMMDHLDYIQGMGFTAVWISPVVRNIQGSTEWGEAFHGYWPQDLHTLNSQFGTSQDLKDLSSALHGRGMYLMVDVVVNHMAYTGSAGSVRFDDFTPFNSSSYFHRACYIDYDNSESVRTCWINMDGVSLADLRTEDQGVREMLQDWIARLVSTYAVDGLRIDTAKHIEPSFFPAFGSAAGVYMMGEVFDGNPANFEPWLGSIDGLLNMPLYYWILRAFSSTSSTMTELVKGINTMKASMRTSTLGVFIENHDLPRFESKTSDGALVLNAVALSMLADGIPIVYQGQEQGFSGGQDPYNREAVWSSGYNTGTALYRSIATLNRFRSHVISRNAAWTRWQAMPTSPTPTSHTLLMRKGSAPDQVVSILSNIGTGGAAYAVSVDASFTGFAPNQDLVDILSCDRLRTDSSGGLAIAMTALPKVLYAAASLAGSGICSSAVGTGLGTLSPKGRRRVQVGTDSS